VSVNPRADLQASALKTAQNYEKQAINKLRRMGLAAADLELKLPRKSNQHVLESNGLLYDDPTLGI
jgi:COP9 signalosome complex subunit 1